MKIGKLILNNFWTKMIALAFAITTWFYVINALDETGAEKAIVATVLPSYRRMITKKMYIEVVFAENAPEGYNLLVKDVKVEPPYFIVAGPRAILEKEEKLETVPIDISEYRKSVIKDVQIAPISRTIDTEGLMVKVSIPIKKIEIKEAPPAEKQ